MARFRLCRTPGQDCLAAAEKAVPVQHDNSTASVAADLDIRAGPDNGPFTGTAGMGFAGDDHITKKNIIGHGATSIHHC